MSKLVLLQIILCFEYILGQRVNNCLTPSKEAGTCIPITECPPIWKLIDESPKPLDTSTLEFLQQTTCGNLSERRVCCPLKSSATEATLFHAITVKPTPQYDPLNEIVNHPNLDQLDQINCGPLSSERKLDTNETLLYEFPWMALLGYRHSDHIEWKCAGTVINKRYILTSAHCTTNSSRNFQLYIVRLGEYDISKDTDCMNLANELHCTPPVQDIGIERIISHPTFNKPKYANDIALIRLAEYADFTQFAVAPICLPMTRELLSKQLNYITLTGWGRVSDFYKNDVLLKADIKYVKMETCQSLLKISMNDAQFCATAIEGDEETNESCIGDPGGPLQTLAKLKGIRTKYFQYGILSFGVNGCGSLSDVYTDVRFYLKWILDNLQP